MDKNEILTPKGRHKKNVKTVQKLFLTFDGPVIKMCRGWLKYSFRDCVILKICEKNALSKIDNEALMMFCT